MAQLKNKNGFLQSDTKARADILNEQVHLHTGLTNIPDEAPMMREIKVVWKGIFEKPQDP